MAGKCPKKALKLYLGGPGASKIPYSTHFGARAIKIAHLDDFLGFSSRIAGAYNCPIIVV